MPSRWIVRLGKTLLFGAALLASAVMREGPSTVVNQAIIWLPSGVALAGLWLFGRSYWWVISLATLLQRFQIHYTLAVALPAAAGSATEALLGVWVLRRLGFRPTLARLRDVGTLFVAAAVAPLGSIGFSWIARSLVWTPGMPFYSGWDGWWRMNALGIFTVVPPALTWLGVPWRPLSARAAGHATLVAAAMAGLLFVLLRLGPPGTTGVLLLNLALPIALYAAVRFGPRGAAGAGGLAAVLVAAAASNGMGPFGAVPRVERHVALQLFEMAFVTFPLVFGALIAERQDARASGRQVTEQRNAIQQALPDIAYRIRQDGVILDMYVPNGMTSPYPRERVIGQNTDVFLPAEMAAGLQERARRVLTEGITLTVEYPLTVGGRRMMREARCVPYGPGELLAVVRDITERKREEASMVFEARVLELVATGQSTREVFAAITEGIERLSHEGLCSIMLCAGGRLSVVTGPSLPQAYRDVLEGTPVAAGSGSCGTAAFTGRPVVVEDISVHPLWVDFRAHALAHGLKACWSLPIRDSAGEVLGTFAVYYREPRAPRPEELALAERAAALAGITLERERRGEALRRSEDLLASLNMNVNEGLFRATPDARLVYVNRAFARLFGYEEAQALLEPAGADAGGAVAPAELRPLLVGLGQREGDEVRFVRRDGTAFWGLVSCTAVRAADGSILHYDGAIADITARKELEEQFRQSQKMEAVGKLAGGIAHDFNNLLTAIFGYAESIQRETGPGTPAAGHAEGVLNAAKRAAGLTRQLLAYSRQQVLSPQVLELPAVVDQLGGMLRRLIGEDIRLVIQHAGPSARVRVDRGQLEQVILNLVVNARDAMPSGGTLTLRTTRLEVDPTFARTNADLRPGPYVALCVRDTGEGMAPDVQARAFDPFFTTKEQGRGTGLGLSTVYGIVRQSGGAVWLESEPGAGTQAWICLPRVESGVETEVAPAAADAAPVAATVLVVEDEPVVRELVRATLGRSGFAVLEASDGVEALELSRAHAGVIDLLLTDMVMPRKGGRDLAETLRVERPGLKVLFMSGYPNETLDARTLAGTDSAFISKPFTSRDLVERTRVLLHPGVVEA